MEVLRGIIDTDPDVSDDGLSVTVHLAPLTAVLLVMLSLVVGALIAVCWFDRE